MAQTAQAADIAAASAVLKEVYSSDKLEEQVQNDRMLLSWVEKTSEHTNEVGDAAIGFVRSQTNPRTHARAIAGGQGLGAPGRTKRDRWEYDYTANYIQVKINGSTIAKMRTARQAAVREIDDETDDAIEGIKDDLERQLHSNGDALIAKCGTSGSGLVVTLDATEGPIALANGWLKENMYVDIGTTASENSQADDALITAIDETNNTITVSGVSNFTTSSSHYVSIAGNRTGTTSYEWNGLRNITSATSVLGTLDPSSKSFWKAQRVDCAGALSLPKMQDLHIKLFKKGAKYDAILTSPEHQRDYYNLLSPQIRYNSETNLSSGHIEGPDFNGRPVVATQDHHDGQMEYLSKRNLFQFSDSDGIEWQNINTGGDVLAWVQNEDAFQARAAIYGQIGTDRRAAHGALHSIT